jgi:hypothetical protein
MLFKEHPEAGEIPMRSHIFAAALLLPLSTTFALADPAPGPQNAYSGPKIEGRYSGPWVTTKSKKLDGTTNAEIKQLTKDRWQGRFWGVWQQVPFDYTVEFDRVKLPPVELEATRGGNTKKVSFTQEHSHQQFASIPVCGKAMIDGASYEWAGTLSRKQFNIEFSGSRYEGHLELTREPNKNPEK